MSQRAMRLLLLAASLAGPIACAARGGGGGGGTVTPDPDASTGDDASTMGPDVVAPTDNASTCTSPRRMCNGTCVDTSSDTINCGGCGVRCSVGQTCTSGACTGGTTTCTAPRMMCNGACTDVSSDVNNCGLCGRRCSTGQSCSSGTCTGSTGTCTAPRVMCGTNCVDVSSDVANCGLCGFACSSGQRCVGGNCTGSTGTCTAPRTMCSSGCTDTSTDPANCGACGTRCATGQSCSASRCVTMPTGSTYAGATCSNPDPMGGTDPACGADLVCIPTGTTPICTTQCENSTSQATERSMCGGGNSTCLTQGDAPMANSICAQACSPAATSGTNACRTGFVCTGWWYTHSGATPDSPGCFPFCSTNADCGAGATGTICNARRGSCGTTPVDTTRLPDGAPCNPMMTVMVPGSMTPQNIQCRGLCFGVSSADRTQGICGSFINTARVTACPDDAVNIQPLSRTGADNLAICIFRQCTRNSDCRSPLICRYDEQMGMPVTTGPTSCNYPTTAQRTGMP